MSLLKISNKALRQLGVEEIMSLTQQGSRPAARCNAAVVGVVKEVLAEHPFSFATVWNTLSLNATSPPFGYTYSYQLPVEKVKLFDIRQEEDLKTPEINFESVRGNVVYTDATPCYARYTVYFEADLDAAPALFLKACAMSLGAEIASPLSKMDKIPLMEKLYLYYLDRAIRADVSESSERQQDPNRTNTILASRQYPGQVNDEIYGSEA